MRSPLPDHARAGDEAAIADVDQIVDTHRDWPCELDQGLHTCECSGTPSVDTSIWPTGSLAVDGILGPELVRHRRRTRLVPDLIGPTDPVCVLRRHRLLRQSSGFEGVGAMAKELQLAHSSVPERDDVKQLDFDWHAALSVSPALPDLGEDAIVRCLDELKRLPDNIDQRALNSLDEREGQRDCLSRMIRFRPVPLGRPVVLELRIDECSEGFLGRFAPHECIECVEPWRTISTFFSDIAYAVARDRGGGSETASDEPGCECHMKFALMLSTVDFDSAIRGYLTTPLALRFLGSRRNAGTGSHRGCPPGYRGTPALLASHPRGKGLSRFRTLWGNAGP